MDTDEPVAAWFDAVFLRLGDDRSVALRRTLAGTWVHLASLVAAEHPGADLTADLFVDCVPILVLEANVPESATAARSHVSAISRVVEEAVVCCRVPGTPRERSVRIVGCQSS